ncbi:MAG: GDP-mannose 4,6-dehydratase [Candidatus Shapirobacteria bacterium GW2011_GWF2_37_20]|nr:MAG: GDP-mannose 4,6-dehydratase [Candidatus Shapirobacteria bacterium GW2011_GWF2_37_20]
MYIRRDRHCLSVLDLFLFESCCFISFVSNFGAFSAEADFRASNLYLKGDFMGKKALITGVTGQDGSYLTELLLSKGYEVHGIVRRASTMNRERIDHIHRDDHAKGNKLFIHYGDLADGEQISDIVYNVKLVFPIPNIPIEGTSGEQYYGNLIDTLTIEGKEQKFDLELEDHAFTVMSAINKYLQKIGYVFVSFSPGDEAADFMLIKFSELPDYLDMGFLEV